MQACDHPQSRFQLCHVTLPCDSTVPQCFPTTSARTQAPYKRITNQLCNGGVWRAGAFSTAPLPHARASGDRIYTAYCYCPRAYLHCQRAYCARECSAPLCLRRGDNSGLNNRQISDARADLIEIKLGPDRAIGRSI